MGDGWKDALRRTERIPKEVREPSIVDRAVRIHSAAQAAAMASLGHLPSVIAGRDLTKPPSLSNPEACWDLYVCATTGKRRVMRIANNCTAEQAAQISARHNDTYPKDRLEIRETSHGTRWAYVPVPGIWGPIVPPDPKPVREPTPEPTPRNTFALDNGEVRLTDERGRLVVVKGEQELLDQLVSVLYLLAWEAVQ